MKQADKMAEVIAQVAEDVQFWQGTALELRIKCRPYFPEIDTSKPYEEFWVSDETHFNAMLGRKSGVGRALISKNVSLWDAIDGTYRLVLHDLDSYSPEFVMQRVGEYNPHIGTRCQFCHLHESDPSEFCDQWREGKSVRGFIHPQCLHPWFEWRRMNRFYEKQYEANKWQTQ